MFISVIERRAALDDAARGAWRGAADAFSATRRDAAGDTLRSGDDDPLFKICSR
jgi:hypothetical protein